MDKIKKIMNIFDSAFYPTGAEEVHRDYAKVVIKNASKIIKILQKNENLKEITKQDILVTTFSLEEMAIADFANIDTAAHDDKKLASIYIGNAKKRGLNDKQIISGLGATFNTILKKKWPGWDEKGAKNIKAEIKKQLGITTEASKDKSIKATVTKKAKEDTVYKGTEKVKAAAKRASEVMKEDIFKNAGVDEARRDGTRRDGTGPHGRGLGPGKGKGCDDKSEFACKYCGIKFKTEKALDKHQKMCQS